MIRILRELWKRTPRLYENEEETARFIISFLKSKKPTPCIQEYEVSYPVYREYYLFTDGERIPCLPSCFNSGKIREKAIIDSYEATFKEIEPEEATINYNPFCNDISTPIFFLNPSLAVRKEDVKKVINSKYVEGKVAVSWKKYKSFNILVGNAEILKKLYLHIMTHFGGSYR